MYIILARKPISHQKYRDLFLHWFGKCNMQISINLSLLCFVTVTQAIFMSKNMLDLVGQRFKNHPCASQFNMTRILNFLAIQCLFLLKKCLICTMSVPGV